MSKYDGWKLAAPPCGPAGGELEIALEDLREGDRAISRAIEALDAPSQRAAKEAWVALSDGDVESLLNSDNNEARWVCSVRAAVGYALLEHCGVPSGLLAKYSALVLAVAELRFGPRWGVPEQGGAWCGRGLRMVEYAHAAAAMLIEDAEMGGGK